MRQWALGIGCIAMLAQGSAGRAQEAAGIGEKTAEKKALTPEAFLELRQVQDPQISPDGTRVAFVVSDPFKKDKRTLHIWMYENKTKSARQLTYSGPDKNDSVPRWSPDGQKLAFLSNRDGEY